MTKERAIEILNPEHREDYKDIETVNEARRMGMEALEYRTPKKPISLKADKDIKIAAGIWKKGVTVYKCPCCDSFISRSSNFCSKCGQAIDRTQYARYKKYADNTLYLQNSL